MVTFRPDKISGMDDKSPPEDKLKGLVELDGAEEIIAKISCGETAGGLIASRLGFGNRGVGMSHYTCR